MTKSESRARPRSAGASKTAKVPVRSKPASAAKNAASRKAVPVNRKAVAAAKARTAKKPVRPKVAASVRAARSRPPAVKRPSRRAASKSRAAPDAAAQLRTLVLDALDDLKARDVQEVDVRGKSSVTDLLVVASGTSSRHVKSIADEVVKKAKQAGQPPIGVEGQREAEWVLVDLGDVIVHVMLPRTREFYGLERLWTVGDDAPAALAG